MDFLIVGIIGLIMGFIYHIYISKKTEALFVPEGEILQSRDGPAFMIKLNEACGRLFSTKIRGGKRFGLPKYIFSMVLSGILFLVAWWIGNDWLDRLHLVTFWSMLLIVFEIDMDYKFIFDEVLIIGILPFIGINVFKIGNYHRIELSYVLYLVAALMVFLVIYKGLPKLIDTRESEAFIAMGAVIIFLFFLKGITREQIFGALFGFGSYFVIYAIAKFIYKEEAFGFGDVLLNGIIGLQFGLSLSITSSIISFFVAVIGVIFLKIASFLYTDKEAVHLKLEVPFGPYMCIAAFIVSIWGTQILEAYKAYVGL